MVEWKQKLQNRNHYDKTAHLYNTRYEEEQNIKFKVVLRDLKIRKKDSILDLGCGTGLLLQKIQRKAESIVGVDLSRKMLEKAKDYTRISGNVQLILADADHIPVIERCFDTVFAITLLQNVPSPFTTLQEIKRITKRDSIIFITGLKKSFSIKSFQNLLENAEMQAKLVKTCEESKCFIAICRKAH